MSRAKIYEEIRSGRLRAVKLGGRTVILRKDLESFLDSLPDLSLADDDPALIEDRGER